MSKAISENLQVHISVAFLIKAMVAVAVVVGSWYQAQMRFASIETRINDMHEELVVLNSKVASMENKHIVALEEENKSLMQRLGLKRK